MFLIFLSPVTLIGNMTLILVLLCKRSRRIKRVNILLMNLAIGDLAVALFVNSTEIFFIAFGDWALGPLMCKISVYVQVTMATVSVFASRSGVCLLPVCSSANDGGGIVFSGGTFPVSVGWENCAWYQQDFDDWLGLIW